MLEVAVECGGDGAAGQAYSESEDNSVGCKVLENRAVQVLSEVGVVLVLAVDPVGEESDDACFNYHQGFDGLWGD